MATTSPAPMRPEVCSRVGAEGVVTAGESRAW